MNFCTFIDRPLTKGQPNKFQDMGMIGNYLRVTEEELEDYLGDSSKLEERVYNDENPDDQNFIDVDKSWEGLFFMLTGQSLATSDEASAPLLWTLVPPQEIDPDQDMGYGPATYTTVDQTKEVSAGLNKISLDEFKSRYNGKLMMEMGIYPEVWDEPECLDYLVEYFVLVKDFYNKATEDNQAVIVFIN